MNAQYVKGRRFEYQVMRALQNAGFSCVRSAGSHGIFDICAWRRDPQELFFIQCAATDIALKRKRIPEDVPPYGQFVFAMPARKCILLSRETDLSSETAVVAVLDKK